jgi:cysteine-rich repeat protein
MLRNPISLRMSGLIAALLAGTASAQTSSDGGIVDSGSVDGGSPALVGVCPSGVVIGSFTGANTQLGRTFRDSTPSTCDGKVYPGPFAVGTTMNFETFTFANTSSAATCTTVRFDPNNVANPCGFNAFVGAYLGSYDPANQAANYIGDVGASETLPFSFVVPGATDLVLAVTNSSVAALCSFSLEVLNLPCAICGDGILPQTSCGDGGIGSLGCDAGCSLSSCGLPTPGLASEACDEGAETATCNADCSLAVCGDGQLNSLAGEICDDGAASATCDVDCSLPVCGDGVVNVPAGEACDDGATADGDGCAATCTLEVPASGGDDAGVIDAGGQSGSAATGSGGSITSTGGSSMSTGGSSTGGSSTGGSIAQGGQAGSATSGEAGVGIDAPIVDDDGCDCRVAKSNTRATASLWGLALAFAVALRRRGSNRAARS